jgi:carbamoyl-phosphate synthase/aspartate carbamoyltransferase/dihydroorotase
VSKIINLPGLIDPHVHLRDPWQLQKEDFYTGTRAALAGGYTTILDMPNNQEHITTEELLDKKIASAKSKIVCDVGFYFSSLGGNIEEFSKVKNKTCGMKLFITVTTNMAGQRALSDIDELESIVKAWPADKPILFHAEDETVELGIEAVRRTKHTTHFCHISSEQELIPILRAKEAGLPVSCGVCPHHLFLTEDDIDRLGPFGKMKPSLKSRTDQKFLWDHLDAIDVIESDHAPHTKQEKETTEPPGVPGIETTLPLMLTAQAEGRITRQQLIDRLHANPARIFNVRTDDKTHVEVNLEEYEIKNEDLFTKAGWSPFAGRKVIGKVQRVILRGQTVFEDGKVLAAPGSGKILP